MDKIAKVQEQIATSFKKLVNSDKKLKNAYLLVHSEKSGIDLNIAEGKTDEISVNPKQANYLASVGKLFTATLVSMFNDKGLLTFDDKIAQHIDEGLMRELHVYKGKDYSADISIKHLLKQTSGLDDVFFPLLEKMKSDSTLEMTAKEAVEWGKANLEPLGKPGQKHYYTDTNYYLLGLIIEGITQKPFHEVVHEIIFEPLGMDNAFISGFSEPKNKPEFPPAHIVLSDIDFIEDKKIAKIDYAGGGVVAPLSEFLIFMDALVNGQLVKEATLHQMIYDDVKMGFPAIGFDYGYSVWKPKSIPVLMPEKYFCWGCVGITGAFMFFHPETKTYVIGNFNDESYSSKALSFMIKKIIKPLLKPK